MTMSTPSRQGIIPVRRLFADLDGSSNKRLKSQSAVLQIEVLDDYPRVLSYLTKAALVKQFDSRVAKKLDDQLKKGLDLAGWNTKTQGPKLLDSEEGYAQSWQLFDQLCAEAFTLEDQPHKYLGMDAAKMLLQNGVSALLTHLDKSSELVQKPPVKASFVSDMLKSMGQGKCVPLSDDASILVKGAFGTGLPIGVTMNAEDQASLGIVCSSNQSFMSAAGNAGAAPQQQMFLTRLAEPGGPSTSLLDVILTDDLTCLGKMLGVSGLTLDLLRSYLRNAEGPLAFYATLYFGLNQLASGGFDGEIELIESQIGGLEIEAKSLYNAPTGRGIHNVILQSAHGYVHATPLINAGLLKDIHQMRDLAQDKEDPWLWRQMFNRVAVGGSNPQNSGIFFSSVVQKGKLNALYANLSTQQSSMRGWKKRLREGRALYWIPKERALSVSSRKSIPEDPTWFDRKLHRMAKDALVRRVGDWVDEVVDQLCAVSTQFEKGLLSVGMINPSSKPEAKAEQSIFLGSAKAHDVTEYARYLCWQLFKSTNMTKAEKHAASTAVAGRLSSRLRAGI